VHATPTPVGLERFPTARGSLVRIALPVEAIFSLTPFTPLSEQLYPAPDAPAPKR